MKKKGRKGGKEEGGLNSWKNGLCKGVDRERRRGGCSGIDLQGEPSQ